MAIACNADVVASAVGAVASAVGGTIALAGIIVGFFIRNLYEWVNDRYL